MAAPVALPPQFGRYRIEQKLGEGGIGAVYLAEDTLLGRKAAVKVPHFSADDGPLVLERFLREARAAAALDHPNLCQVFDPARSAAFITWSCRSSRARPCRG